MHVSHPQAFIIYIAAPLKHQALWEVEMRNLPPNLEATHIYTARLSESGARSVKIIIRSLETSSSSAQAAAAAAALRCRWPGPVRSKVHQHRCLHDAISFFGKNSGDNKCETTSVVFAPLGSEFGPHCFAGRSICATSSKRENQAELVSMAVFFKLIYANNAYLVNVSKIRHPLGICTATNTVINERALRCKDFIASSP